MGNVFWVPVGCRAQSLCFWRALTLWSSELPPLPGASVRNPAHGKGHEEGSQTHTKAWSSFRGSPWVFLNIYPPKPELAWFYCTVLSTLLTFSGKKLIQGFSLLHMKGMFQLKPLWWLSNLPDRFPRTFYNLWIAYSPPTARGTKLKAS